MGLLEEKFEDNIIVASFDKILSWARSTSPWFFQFGLACCAIELMATGASRHDLSRIGRTREMLNGPSLKFYRTRLQ
jgi:NADH-quinone oxidoreductase subunit B